MRIKENAVIALGHGTLSAPFLVNLERAKMAFYDALLGTAQGSRRCLSKPVRQDASTKAMR